MNRAKKQISLLMALMMMLTMVSTAMAATATVTNETSGHSYKAYQIFSGTQAAAEGMLGDLDWGTGVNKDALIAALIAEKFAQTDDNAVLNANSTAADVAALLNEGNAEQFANIVAEHLSSEYTQIGAAADSVEIEIGYYLLVDDTDVSGKEDARNSALLEVVKDITIQRKYETPAVEKKINEKNALVDTANVSIGDSVSFELTGTIAENYDDYETYKYVFHDTMSAGLTYNDDAVVYVKNGDTETQLPTDAFQITAAVSEADDTKGQTTLTISCENLKAIQGVDIDEASKIIVKYTAALNDQAVIDGPNPNTVKLEYSNDPNFDADGDDDGQPDEGKTPPTGFTPEDTVEVYTTKVEITKTDDKGNILTGAAFRIAGQSAHIVVTTGEVYVEDNEAGTYYKLNDGTYTMTAPTGDVDPSAYASTDTKYSKVDMASLNTQGETPVNAEGFVNAGGKLEFAGLGVGTYTITEIVTPAGYNTISDITLDIGFDPDTKAFSYTWSGGVTGTGAAVTVINNSGATLPETGGTGTTMLYVGGGVLIVAAIALLIAKKRKA